MNGKYEGIIILSKRVLFITEQLIKAAGQGLG